MQSNLKRFRVYAEPNIVGLKILTRAQKKMAEEPLLQIKQTQKETKEEKFKEFKARNLDYEDIKLWMPPSLLVYNPLSENLIKPIKRRATLTTKKGGINSTSKMMFKVFKLYKEEDIIPKSFKSKLSKA